MVLGDEILPKRSPNGNQRLVMINGICHVLYSVRNSLDQLEHFQWYCGLLWLELLWLELRLTLVDATCGEIFPDTFLVTRESR